MDWTGLGVFALQGDTLSKERKMAPEGTVVFLSFFFLFGWFWLGVFRFSVLYLKIINIQSTELLWAINMQDKKHETNDSIILQTKNCKMHVINQSEIIPLIIFRIF